MNCRLKSKRTTQLSENPVVKNFDHGSFDTTMSLLFPVLLGLTRTPTTTASASMASSFGRRHAYTEWGQGSVA